MKVRKEIIWSDERFIRLLGIGSFANYKRQNANYYIFTRSKLIHFNVTFARDKVKTDSLQIGGNSPIHKLADQSSLLHNNSGHQHCCSR